MDVCNLWLLCVVRSRNVQRADHFTDESHGCLSVVSDVCCQLEVCATGCSLVQRSPMDVCLL